MTDAPCLLITTTHSLSYVVLARQWRLWDPLAWLFSFHVVHPAMKLAASLAFAACAAVIATTAAASLFWTSLAFGGCRW